MFISILMNNKATVEVLTQMAEIGTNGEDKMTELGVPLAGYEKNEFYFHGELSVLFSNDIWGGDMVLYDSHTEILRIPARMISMMSNR